MYVCVCACVSLLVPGSVGLQHSLLTVTFPPRKWPCLFHSLQPSNLFFPSPSPSILHSFAVLQPSIIPLSLPLSSLDPPVPPSAWLDDAFRPWSRPPKGASWIHHSSSTVDYTTHKHTQTHTRAPLFLNVSVFKGQMSTAALKCGWNFQWLLTNACLWVTFKYLSHTHWRTAGECEYTPSTAPQLNPVHDGLDTYEVMWTAQAASFSSCFPVPDFSICANMVTVHCIWYTHTHTDTRAHTHSFALKPLSVSCVMDDSWEKANLMAYLHCSG